MYVHIAKQILDDLALRYSQMNVPRLFHLRKGLSFITQGSKSISTYFTKFHGLTDELGNLSLIPKCSCLNSTCTCGNSLKLDQYDNMLNLSQFFMGLNNQFTAARGQILLMTLLPDTRSAYDTLLQEENQRDFATHTKLSTENFALNVKLINLQISLGLLKKSQIL